MSRACRRAGLDARGEQVGVGVGAGWKRKLGCAPVIHGIPDGLAFHGENLLLAPFAMPPPTTELSGAFYGEILAELRGEVKLLRRLTGQPLLSLELSGPASKGAEVERLS